MSGHHRVAIIGAGLGGLSAAHHCLAGGVDHLIILEAASSPGGTWYHNRYPGADCDVISHLYSFSWAPNPQWSRRYARQPEILDFIQRTVTDHGMTPHLRLSTSVQAMTWNEDLNRWHIATDRVTTAPISSSLRWACSTSPQCHGYPI